MSLTVRVLRSALVLGLAGLSAGFSSTALFEEPTDVGGGAGYAFTGSPSAHGLSCATCHQGAVRHDGIDLWSVPEGLFDDGYVAGQDYVIHLRIAEERRGLERNGACPPHAGGCNRNGFVAELRAGGGETMGALCTDDGSFGADGHCQDATGPTTALMAAQTAVSGHSLAQPRICGVERPSDCVDVAGMQAAGATQAEIDAAILASVRGRTAWSFQWRAPLTTESAAPTGTLFLGVVDGDGGVSVDPAHNDFYGDEVYLVERAVFPLGKPPAAASAGCSSARATGTGLPPTGALGWLLAAALPLLLGGRRLRRAAAWGAVVALIAVAAPQPADAADTSCDITTGASCLWGEGCDCDHDGYVRDTGKAKKYCHFSKCPLDSNDNDPKQLGKASVDNADGDGWTKSYDCDDNDPCIGKTCGVSTCVVVVDNDKDGTPAGEDCDDNDANVYPGAAIACCNCTILADPAKAASFGCSAGCPLSNPPVDAGSTDATQPDTAQPDTTQPDTTQPDTTQPDTAQPDTTQPDTTQPDTTQPDTGSADAGQDAASTDTTGGSDGLPVGTDIAGTDGSSTGGADAATGGHVALDAGYAADAAVGGGVLDLPQPPAPGCTASPRGASGFGGLWALLAAVAAFALLRGRRRALAWLLLAVGIGSAGCATVKPWQRERLAHRCMIFGAEGGELTNEQHAFQYREGAAGGFGGGGGGCGCN